MKTAKKAQKVPATAVARKDRGKRGNCSKVIQYLGYERKGITERWGRNWHLSLISPSLAFTELSLTAYIII